MAQFYDEDFLTWSERQAELLRRRAAGDLAIDNEIDWLNLAEEFQCLRKGLIRELESKITAIMQHLLLLQASSATDQRRRWGETINSRRDQLERLLEQAPSVQNAVPAVIEKQIGRARKWVLEDLADHDEQPLVDIEKVTFTEDQVLRDRIPR